MNKLFSKIAALSVGLAMAVGVGVAVGSGSKGAEVAKAADGSWEKATSIQAGDEVVFVCEDAGKELTAISTTSTKYGIGSDYSDSPAGTFSFVVESGYSSETFSFKNSSNNYLYWTSGNSLNVNSTKSNNTSWTVAISDGKATVKNAADSARQIWWNSNSPRFACYTGKTEATSGYSIIQIYKWVSASGKDMRVQDNNHNQGPINVSYGDDEYKYLLGWDIDDNHSINSGCSWTVSEDNILDWHADGYTWFCYKPITVGSVTVTCSCEGYKSASIVVNVLPGTVESVVVSGSMTKTSYYVGEEWSVAGLVATANYDTGYSGDVSSEAEWSFNPASPVLDVTSVVATAEFESVSGSSSAQAVTVAKTNQIQVQYTKSSGASVDVYGYYVGFLDGTGPVIMDGEYGIVIYNKTADVSDYAEKVTILHVTGSISIYNGLYEIGSPSISVATEIPEDKVPSTPVVYAAKGGETADYASRLTTVTGVPTVTKGSFDSDAGTADITMNFAVASQTVQVFYKKAAQTADADAFSAIKAAVEGSSEITIKGFTGWFNGFQVQMNGYVPPAEGYTAEDFAQDLLDQTDAICVNYVDGESSYSSFKTQLEAVWSDLASNDKYPALPSEEKTVLATAERDPEGSVIEQAMARYDFLTGKYELSNFINGRTPMASANNPTFTSDDVNSNMMIIVIVIASVSVLAISCLLILKKKRK